MSKSNKQKFKKNDRAWSTFAPNSKLQVKAVGHVYEHNAIEWVENWRYTKLGTYSEEAAQMGISMRFSPFDPEAEAAKYPLVEELAVLRDDFILTEAQMAEIMAIPAREAIRRENRKAELFQAWVAPRKAQNSLIKASNYQNAESLKRIPHLAQKNRDMYAKIFQEMEADMNEAARDIIRRTAVTRNVLDAAARDGRAEAAPAAGVAVGPAGVAAGPAGVAAGPAGVAAGPAGIAAGAAAAAVRVVSLSYEDARSSWDFVWILEAAIHGLIKKGADENDPHEILIRKKELKKKIEEFKQGTLEWSAYVRAMKRLWEHGAHLGLNLDDTERVAILMGNIQPEIFRHQIAMFRDPVQRLSMPHFGSYDDLVEALSAVVRMTDDAILIRAQGRPKVESSFVVEEGSKIGQENKSACHICGARDKSFHFARDCPFRNKKKSVAENIAYFQKNPRALAEARERVKQDKKRKRDAESGSGTVQGSVGRGQKSEEGRSETTMVSFEVTQEHEVFQPVEFDEQTVETTECSYLVARSRRRGVGPGQVDFILDTATESSTIRPADSSLASNLRDDPITLVGVGDRQVVSEASGESIFGQTRVLEQKNNLVSQYQVRQYYRLVEVNEDCFELVPRGSTGELPTWTFVRDYDRYGDNLLHCTVDRRLFMNTTGRSAIECLSMFQVEQVKSEKGLSRDQINVLEKVELVHEDLNHASATVLIRTVKSESDRGQAKERRIGLTVDEINFWNSIRGHSCKGCIRGKLTDYSHKPSTREESYLPGEAAGGDLMFIEVKTGATLKPLLVTVDCNTQLGTITTMEDKSAESICAALSLDQANKRSLGHPMKVLYFDREPSVIAKAAWMKESLGITLIPKAAGQHVGNAERYIRTLKDTCRATKIGVYDKYGYMPPMSWNVDLVLDVNSSLNVVVRSGKSKSPIELLTGNPPDRLRGLRGLPWGSVILTKPPRRSEAANINEPKAEYSVVVRRMWDRSGVIKVYQVLSGKYAYRLLAKKVATIPEWVLAKLQVINQNAVIGYEDDSDTDSVKALSDGSVGDINAVISDLESPALEKLSILLDSDEIDRDEVRDLLKEVLEEPEYTPAVGLNEPVISADSATLPSGSVIDDAKRYPQRERNAPIRFPQPETYLCYAMTYGQAYKVRPEKAVKALDTELDNWHRAGGWKPVRREDLSKEEQKAIIQGLSNFVEKYDQDGNHIKDKVRVLVNGSQQVSDLTGETHGAVCRFESLALILQLVAVQDLVPFRLDVVAAFLKTPMNSQVKHKWVHLSRDISQRMIERWPEVYGPYVDCKGRILVEMLKIGYGYKEAGHFFGELLREVLADIGFVPCASDVCVWMYDRDGMRVICGTTVDDCCGGASSLEAAKWFHEEVERRLGVGEATLEVGDKLNWVGMQVEVKRTGGSRSVELSQHKYLADSIKEFGVTSVAPTPATATLFEIDPDSPLLTDQRRYMSAVATAAFAANRTVPQAKVAVHFCATRFGKATDEDWRKIMRVFAYLNGIKDTQKVILNAVSLSKIIVTADSAYALDTNCKSTSAGCIGFPGVEGTSYFIWIHKIQPIVTRSSSEAELVAAAYVTEFGLWVSYMLDELMIGRVSIELEQDNTASINFINRGRGTFARTKHIKVREFWIAMLIEAGELVVKHVPTAIMTADILSKPLALVPFLRLLKKLIGWDGQLA